MINLFRAKREKEMGELFELLDKAEKLASEFSGGYSNNFSSAEEFHSALVDSIRKLKSGNIQEINRLWLWFAPTCDWDDLIGIVGKDIANETFKLLSDLNR